MTTLSARFDEDQLAVLKRAAGLKQWRLAQLIQIGAWEKAVNILNASGPGSYPVRKLVDELLGRVYEPEIRVSSGEWPDESDCRLDEVSPDESLPASVLFVPPVRDSMIDELTRVMKSLGPELADIVAELNRARKTSGELEAKLIDPSRAPGEVAARLAAEARTTSEQDKPPPADAAPQAPAVSPLIPAEKAGSQAAPSRVSKGRARKSGSRRK
jgi:hypothetical protein